MHSRTSLIIILAVAFTFASNASAQFQSSASSFSTSGASVQSGPLMIELETPEDEQRPEYVKEGHQHQDTSSTAIPRDRGYIDQEYPIVSTTTTSEPRPGPIQGGHHHENSPSASQTSPQNSEGDEVRFEIVTGTENRTSSALHDSDELPNQTQVDDPDNSPNDWRVEE